MIPIIHPIISLSVGGFFPSSLSVWIWRQCSQSGSRARQPVSQEVDKTVACQLFHNSNPRGLCVRLCELRRQWKEKNSLAAVKRDSGYAEIQKDLFSRISIFIQELQKCYGKTYVDNLKLSEETLKNYKQNILVNLTLMFYPNVCNFTH